MNEHIEAALMEAGQRIDALQANERRLIDEMAALRKDAERYRWLRDNACTTQADSLGPIFRMDVRITGKWHLGIAIDAAIASTPVAGAA